MLGKTENCIAVMVPQLNSKGEVQKFMMPTLMIELIGDRRIWEGRRPTHISTTT
jgi:hypothetical protein